MNYKTRELRRKIACPALRIYQQARGLHRILVCCVVAACVYFSANACLFAAEDSKEQGAEPKLVTKSAEVNGVRLEISVPERTAVQQPLPLRIRVENRSDAVVFCGDGGGGPDCHAWVTDVSTGLACPITNMGKNYVAGWPLHGHVSYGLGDVAPGKSKSWNRLDLARCFTLPPGTYRLDLTLNCNILMPEKKLDVPLTGLKFEIVP
ncbi:MAG TPA: hypothetical protein VHZ24_18515 [Pirellulales bacterium]|jgi:hypothetical protein|nr:hypothetical protein [Pirellulales bacterium]